MQAICGTPHRSGGPSVSEAAERGRRGRHWTAQHLECCWAHWCPPSCGPSSLDTGSVSSGSVCCPTPLSRLVRLLPVPSQGTAGRKGLHPTAVEHQVEMRHYFSFWKLNRIIALSCFSVCCCFPFTECFQSPANQKKNI